VQFVDWVRAPSAGVLRTRGLTVLRPEYAALIGAAAVGATLFVLCLVLPSQPLPWLGWDSHVYWEAASAADPYANAFVGELGAYLYSPAFLQVLSPAGALPWLAFAWLWSFATIAIALALADAAGGPGSRLWIPIVALGLVDVWAGNINMLLAGAVVIGFRWPAAWSFVVLTKVSPGAGMLWFALRREWRSLAVATGATTLIVAASAVVAPDLWWQWGAVLTQNPDTDALSGDLPIPGVIRFPAALVLIAWAAPRNHRWALPIACLLLLPVVWPNGYALLVGSAALARPDWARLGWLRTAGALRAVRGLNP
jgi:hypothetical protein